MQNDRHLRFRKHAVGCDGSTFIVTITMMTVLSLIAAYTLRTLTERWRYGMQANSWQEANSAAESGADMAMAALVSGTWTGWTDVNGNSVSSKPSVSGTNSYKTTLSHTAGEGSGKLAAIVKIDAPAGLSNAFGQWYRIRSTGVSEAPKTMHIGFEPGLLDANGNKQAHSNLLRKFSFNSDKSSALLSLPQVSRTIEIIAQAPGPFSGPLTLNNQLTMSGGGWIDAFDSSNPLYSTSGLYDPLKRLSNTTVNVIDTNGASDLKSTYVYGNIKYNGPDIANAGNVQGTTTKPSTATTTPVSTPGWTSMITTPSIINGTTTLAAGAPGSTNRFKVSSVNVPGGKVLTLKNPNPGQEVYIEIWVTGSFTTSGSGYITQEVGVHATYYIEGDITVSGSSFNNQSNVAANNIIYGVTPSTGTHPKLTVSGGGSFIGAIDAPAYDFTISGSANFSGALVGNTMNISGGASVHYDNALSKLGGKASYSVASWVEDIR